MTSAPLRIASSSLLTEPFWEAEAALPSISQVPVPGSSVWCLVFLRRDPGI